MSRTAHEKLLISEKKLFDLYYTNIDTFEIFHALHNRVALLTRRYSERGTQNRRDQRIFRKFWTRHMQNFDQKMHIW